MADLATVHLYLAIHKSVDRSHIEDELVLDGADVSTFDSAKNLWNHFQEHPARFVVTGRCFGDEFGGLELVRRLRKHYMLPYVYVLMRSVMNRMEEIEEGLAAGVDDYLITPHNFVEFRSRILVGMRWLTYIDSIAGEGKIRDAAGPPKESNLAQTSILLA